MTIENNPQPVAPAAPLSATTKPTTSKTVAKKPAAKATPKAAPKAKAKPAADGKYKVLTGIDDETFCARVSEHLDKGWALYGDVAATFNGKNVILAQALLRTKKVKRKK